MAQNESTPVIEADAKSGEDVVVSPGKRKLVESAISSPVVKKQHKDGDSNKETEEGKESSAAEPVTENVVSVAVEAEAPADEKAVSKNDSVPVPDPEPVPENVDVDAGEAPADGKILSKDDSGPDADTGGLVLEPITQEQEETDEVTLSVAKKSEAKPEDAVEVPQAEVTA